MRHIFFSAVLTLSFVVCAKASERPLGKSLAMSQNGNYIVVQEWRLGPDNHVQQLTFQVFAKDCDPWQWMTWKGTYWAPDWSVVLTENQGVVKGKGLPINVWPLIPDNGDFVVLLSDDGPGIWIFRRRTRFDREAPLQTGSERSVLVKAIAVGELLPPEKLLNNFATFVPPWFNQASFEFSPNEQLLIRYSDSPASVVINLKDGAIVSH